MFGWLKRRETRSSGAGYTAEIIAARASYIAGASGIGELTGTVQACVALWENAFQLADVDGTDLLNRASMGVLARALALRGEFVGLIADRQIIPASDWEVATRNGTPTAYRLNLPDAGGGRAVTALAGEVLHVRIGSDPVAPWAGTAPLRRAALTAQLLQELETALRDVYRDAPLGSQIVPLPESDAGDMAAMRAALRGRRGASLVIEGVAQSTAAGMNPNIGQKPNTLTPDLQRAVTGESLAAAKASICMVFGVLPGLINPATTGPMVREAQRHLAGWVLQPMAELLAQEASAKLGAAVRIDVGRPLQAFDAGGRARALSQLIEAMGRAKELGLTPAQIDAALTAVNWGGGDANA